MVRTAGRFVVYLPRLFRSPLSSWMQCYTEAVSTQCAVSGPEGTSSAIYVLSAQQKLIGKLAVAAACQGQEFTRITVAGTGGHSIGSNGLVKRGSVGKILSEERL